MSVSYSKQLSSCCGLSLLEPGIDAAAQGDDVGEAAFAEDIDGLGGADAAGAIYNGYLVPCDIGVFTGEDAVEGKMR